MTAITLPNQLIANRKSSCFSQKEVAFLVGLANAEQVSRYERFEREPSLKTALALEAVFKKPVRELFSGVFAEIEAEVAVRAQTLLNESGSGRTKEQAIKRSRTLTNLTGLDSKHLIYQ